MSADCGTTSSGDYGTTSTADCGTASGGDHGTTSEDCRTDSGGETGGDCGANSGQYHSTERDFTYTDFAAGPQPAAIGSSSPSGPQTQSDTRTPEEIQAQEQQAEARAQKRREERKSKEGLQQRQSRGRKHCQGQVLRHQPISCAASWIRIPTSRFNPRSPEGCTYGGECSQ